MSNRKGFGIFVGIMMKSPFELTWALPEFDGVGLIRDKKFPQFVKYCSQMNLKRMRFTTEDCSSRVDRVGYGNNLGDVVDGACLINATSDSKQLRLHACYKGSMVNRFD